MSSLAICGSAICWSAIGIAIMYPVVRKDDALEKYLLLFLSALFGPLLLLIALRVLVETALGWRTKKAPPNLMERK